jgi:predicted anti-sigma-YlaC factor YlaD
MKCSLIRDLMPIYDEGKCSKESEKIILEHLKKCESCRTLFEDMHKELGLKSSIEVQQEVVKDKGSESEDTEFWSRYYGRMIIKGVGMFIFVYIVAIILRKYF